MLEFLRGRAGPNIVGGDVVEGAPQYDITTDTAQAGARILFEIPALVVDPPTLRVGTPRGG